MRTLSIAFAAIVAAGCAPVAVDPSPAGDAEAAGTDPAEPGDEPRDETEEEAEPASVDVDNAWSVTSELPDGLEGTGWGVGDTAYNFRLVDQNGDEVELYQFYGQVIMIDIFTEWCGPCQDAAPENQAFYEEMGPDGLVVLATMEDANAGKPDQAAAARWADAYSLTHPVLADPDMSQDAYVTVGYPTVVLIDRDMTIVNPDLWPVKSNKIEDLVYAAE